MRFPTLVFVSVSVAALTLLGCPPKDKTDDTKGSTKNGPCKKVGDSCEYSAGKLGTCVSIDICEKPPCGFACQSQH